MPGEEFPPFPFFAWVGALLFLGLYLSAAISLPIRAGDHDAD